MSSQVPPAIPALDANTVTDPVALLSILQNMQAVIGQQHTDLVQARADLAATQTNLNTTQQELANAEQEIIRITNIPVPAPVITVAPPNVTVTPNVTVQAPAHTRAPKMNLPDTYSGDTRGETAKVFIQSCRLYISSRPNDFPNEAAQIRWVLGLLSGSAKAWASSIMESALSAQPSAQATQWAEFHTAFSTAWYDPNEKTTAAAKLRALKQVRSVAEYAAEFRRLVSILGYTEDGNLQDTFRHGLKDTILDVLVTHADPASLNDLVTTANNIDVRLQQRVQEKRSEQTPPRRPFNPPTSTPAPPPFNLRNNPFARAPQFPVYPPRVPNAPPPRAPATPGPFPRPQNTNNPFRPAAPPRPPAPTLSAPARDPNAMDIGAGRGRLTPEERARRLREGLCLYCGQSGHRASDHGTGYANATQEYDPYLAAAHYYASISATQSYAPNMPSASISELPASASASNVSASNVSGSAPTASSSTSPF